MYRVCVYLSPVNVECDPASQVQTILSVLILTSAVRPTIFQTMQRAQRRNTATLQVRLRVLWCVGAGIGECLKGWRCMVGVVEEWERGRRVWWEGWRVWWEGWRVWWEG